MASRLFLGIVLLSLTFTTRGQYHSYPSSIDRLEALLRKLRDSARVDCLNELGFRYCQLNQNVPAERYATMALEEATRLHYVHGVAEAYVTRAAVQRRFYNNFYHTELLARHALHLYQSTPNKKGLAYGTLELGLALFAESKYEEALVHLERAFAFFRQKGMSNEMLVALSNIGQVYRESGQYDKAFSTFRNGLQLAQRYGNLERTIEAYVNIGDLYMAIEDYPTALTYYRNLFRFREPEDFGTDNLMVYAELLSRTRQYDSARYYYNRFDSAYAGKKELRYYLVSKGEYYLDRNDYKNSLKLLLKGLEYHRQLNDQNETRRALLSLAKLYAAMNRDSDVLYYGRESLRLALHTRSKPSIRDAYGILYTAYDRLGQTDSAYLAFRRFEALKDEVANAQVKGRFAAYNYDQKIALLQKEKELQEARLQQDALLRKILISGIAAILFMTFFLVRNFIFKRRIEADRRALAENELQIQKLEASKLKSEMQQRTAELEFQALRAQMDPHFIFNCLNAVNHFIVNNETEEASDYLTRFARLIRTVLQSSSRKYILLADELETLELYIQLEQVRFQKHFQYTLYCDPRLDAETIMIPPMLLQPYVENAIWHGLMHQEGPGQLDIRITRADGVLLCSIADNGIGRRKAAELKSKSASKHKSMGMQITANRLQMLSRESKAPLSVDVIDHEDEYGQSRGTEVIVRIPIRTGETITA